MYELAEDKSPARSNGIAKVLFLILVSKLRYCSFRYDHVEKYRKVILELVVANEDDRQEEQSVIGSKSDGIGSNYDTG